MSSLLAIQTKDEVLFASDTASSVTIDGISYRVSDNVTKLFSIGNYVIFVSGNLSAQQLLMSHIKDTFNIDTLETLLKNHFNSLGEYSLEILIGEKISNGTIVHTFSSYDNFDHTKSTNISDDTFLFTAGIKTKEISSAFERKAAKNPKLLESIQETYQENYCEQVGGFIEIIKLSNQKRISHKLAEKNLRRTEIKSNIRLIVGERIYGKIISGVNLAIEDESGILKFRGSRGQIFDRNGDEQMRLGLVTDSPDEECFGILLDNRKHRVHMTSCDGFMIEKWESNSWKKKMYADLDGNFWVENFTAKEITIIDNDGYFNFEGNKGKISDGNNPVMWLGYIPSGSVSICSPPSDFGTILKGINNSLIYMTKNRGFAIDVNCENKFRVDTDGSLYAKDIVTHNLKIVNGELGEKIILDHEDGITINGNDGEQIRLNANEGIAIDVNQEKRVWIGKDGLIYAKKLHIMGDDADELIEDVDGSYISDLTVNKLKTLNSNDPQNFVHIEDNFIKLKTRTSVTQEEEKFTLQFMGTGQEAYPHMTWGAGGVGGGGNNIGYMYKTQSRFSWEYVQTDGSKVEMGLMNTHPDSIMMKTPHGIKLEAGQSFRIEAGGQVLVMDSQGIRLVGTRIDLN